MEHLLSTVQSPYRTVDSYEAPSRRSGVQVVLVGSAILGSLLLALGSFSNASSLALSKPLTQAKISGAVVGPNTRAGVASGAAQTFVAAPVGSAQQGFMQTGVFSSFVLPALSAAAAAVAFFVWRKTEQPKQSNVPIDWTAAQTAMFAASGEKSTLVEWYGPNRNLFLGPLSDGAPSWLKGEMPGDYGFDVLELASHPERLEQYRQAEIINGRWAMLGTLGCIAPELLAKYGGVPLAEPVWFKAGTQVFNQEGLNYLGNTNLVHAQSITAILVSELVLIGLAEAFRTSGGPLGPAGDKTYPGGIFDPLGLSKDATLFAEMKVKEVKNGRLAMLSILGYFMQGLATREGPWENLLAHIADPSNNIISYHQKVLEQIGGVAMFSASGEKSVQWYGPNRSLFLGPLSDGAPAWLKGEMPGDYGFDILELASHPERLEQYRQAEIINGRWAMLGTLGCIAPELLAKYGGVPLAEPVWFKAGTQVFNQEGLNYLGNTNLVHAQSITAILVSELVLIGLAEAFRTSGGPLGPAGDKTYPGGIFDPLGLSKDATLFAEMKVKEVKNGRLAMLSILGYFMQGLATREGPWENLLAHIADPSNNIISYHQKVLEQIGGVAMFAASGQKAGAAACPCGAACQCVNCTCALGKTANCGCGSGCSCC